MRLSHVSGQDRLCEILVEDPKEMVDVIEERVAPSAARLTESLRDIGYDTPTAIADLIDNAISAGAREIHVDFEFHGRDSAIVVWDDGEGMPINGIHEALRFGSRRDYKPDELGRFGLGLKTASFSQCRRLTVLSKYKSGRGSVSRRTLDLDLVAARDEWLIHEGQASAVVRQRDAQLGETVGGTTVVLENLDRILNERTAHSGVGKRRLKNVSTKVAEHLSVVFHRYLEGVAATGKVSIIVDGQKLVPWDPFATSNDLTQRLPAQLLSITIDGASHDVRLQRYVLPAKNELDSIDEFEALSGPLKWNRQQGLYFYRVDRLVQFGGWSGMRGLDEHSKLARASIDFPTELDVAFQINVAKMRINLPPEIKPALEKPIQELCIHAGERYRRAGGDERHHSAKKAVGETDMAAVGVALRAAALRSGGLESFDKAMSLLKKTSPSLHRDLGLS